MEAPRLERKLVAILAADVEGYSRPMERDEAATSGHRVIVDELVNSHNGRMPERPTTACWQSSPASSDCQAASAQS